MQINFSTIEIEGFRSIVEPQTFNLDRPGLNMVKGVNGAGKTTLFEALVWCLYGTNLKGTVSDSVKSWKEVQGNNYKGVKVITHFLVDKVPYIIERTRSYQGVGDSITVKKDGVDIGELGVDDNQTYIDALLTMDFNTFMNSFMFGQRMTRLVESKNVDKRKLFEELFNMDWIQNMRDKAAADRTDKEKELQIKEQEITSKSMSTGIYLENVEEAEERLKGAKEADTIKHIEDKRMINNWTATLDELGAQKAAVELAMKNLPEIVPVEDNSAEIIQLEGKSLPVENELDELAERKNILSGRLEAKAEKLNSYDASSYDTYLSNLAKIEGQMKDIVGKLYQDDGAFLSPDEELTIQKEYEDALTAHNQLVASRNKLVTDLRDLEEGMVCGACKRPFDNVEEKEEHKRHIQKELDDGKSTLLGSAAKVDATRADAVLLQEYQKLNMTRTAMGDNAPEDPEVEKLKLKEACDVIEDDIDALSIQIKEKYLLVKEYENAIQALENKQGLMSSVKEENHRIQTELTGYERDLKQIEAEAHTANNNIEQLKAQPVSQVPKLEEELKEKQNKLETAQQDKLDLEAEKGVLEQELAVISFWLKDVLAANGLKAYIFKAMLDELNQYTEKYGAKLGCSIRFSLDLTKVSAPFSTICTLGDKVNKDYKEFSGGEKQRLDIVLMFAMHDLLSFSTDINLLIMDEVFEGLDEQGESDVFELIKEKAEGRSVYVISHSQMLDTLYSKTIEVFETDGKTTISC